MPMTRGARITPVDAIDGLITAAERRQARTVEDLPSDPGHEPGIARRIGDRAFAEQAPAGPLRACASRSNRARWTFGQHEGSGITQVLDEANPPAGGSGG